MSTSIKISLKNQTVTPVKSEIKEERELSEKHNDSTQDGDSSLFDTSEYIEDEDGFEGFDIAKNETESGFEGLDIDPEEECDFDHIEPTLSYSTELGDIDKNEDSNGTDSDYNTLIHREDPTNRKEGSYDSYLRSEENTLDEPCRNEQETSDEKPLITSCSIDPNFAIIVDFMEKFGDHIGLKNIPMKLMEEMLCDTNETVHPDLVQLHAVLLKKIKLSKKLIITKKSWIKGLILFCNGAGGMIYEGLELQNVGYSQLSVNVKLEMLKVLMESQFDWNELVRALVDDLPVEAMRNEPTGKDIEGQRYWTQIDDLADIRIYSESSDNAVWENIVLKRADLVDLVDKLKQNKLYKAEMEKIKATEAEKEEQEALVSSISEMENVQKEEFNTDYKCEVCMLDMKTKLDLMEHYSGGHMAFNLKEKFEHLVNQGQCKICKFEADDEHDIYVHIGTLHEKVNSVLKEQGLKPVGDTIKELTPEDTKEDLKLKPDEDLNDIEKLERKIAEVQKQMCASEFNKSEEKCDRNICDNNVDIGEGNQISENEEKVSEMGNVNEETNSLDSCDNKSDYTEASEQVPNNEIDQNFDEPDEKIELNRPRRSRACKEKWQILKAADSPPKKDRKTKELDKDLETKKEHGHSSNDDDMGSKTRSRKRKKQVKTKSKQKNKKKKSSYEDDDDYSVRGKQNEQSGSNDKKIIDVTKEMKVKERVEIKLSCKKCNQWQTETDKIFECKTCTHSWHQFCVKPPLYYKPKKDWLCPLCNHIALVQNMEQTIVELDILMEKAEEKRLAAIIENQNQALMETDEDSCSTSAQGPTSAFAMPSREPSSEAEDFRLPPDYFESSDEAGMDSDEEWRAKPKASEERSVTPKVAECTCESSGTCLFCKKKKGCTCEGMGTCRLCALEEEKSQGISHEDDALLADDPSSPPKMSTTEMFLLTGQARKVEVEVQEDDGFVYRGKLRGRGAVKRPKRSRGSRGSGGEVGQQRVLPPGITIVNSDGNTVPKTAVRGLTPRGRPRLRGRGSRGVPNRIDNSNPQNVVSQNQIVKVKEEIDVIEIDMSDEEQEDFEGNASSQGFLPHKSSNGVLQRGQTSTVRQRPPRGSFKPTQQRKMRQRGKSERGYSQQVSGGVLKQVLQRNIHNSNFYDEEAEDDPSYADNSQQELYVPQQSTIPIQQRFQRIRGNVGKGTSQQSLYRGPVSAQPVSQIVRNSMEYEEEEDASHLYNPDQGIYDPQGSVIPIQQKRPRQRGRNGRIIQGSVQSVSQRAINYFDEEDSNYMEESEQEPYDPQRKYLQQGLYDSYQDYEQQIARPVQRAQSRKIGRGRIQQNVQESYQTNINSTIYEDEEETSYMTYDSQGQIMTTKPKAVSRVMRPQSSRVMRPQRGIPIQRGAAMRGLQPSQRGQGLPQRAVPNLRGRRPAQRVIQPLHRGMAPIQRGMQQVQRGGLQPIQRNLQPIQRGGAQQLGRGLQPGQRGLGSGQRGGLQPVQRVGLQPVQREGLQQVQRGGLQQVQRGRPSGQRMISNVQRGVVHPVQRGAVAPRRGVLPRGSLPVQRMRGSAVPGRAAPVATIRGQLPQRRGGNQMQMVSHPQNILQRGVMSGRGRTPQRQIVSNPRRIMQPVMARGRGQRMQQPRPVLTQPSRGQQPVNIRRPQTRGRPQLAQSKPRMPILQNQYAPNNYENSFEDDDDIVIPSVNTNFDYDMIADEEIAENEEMPDDDNIMSENYRNFYQNDENEYSEEDVANLSRLPSHIQIERY